MTTKDIASVVRSALKYRFGDKRAVVLVDSKEWIHAYIEVPKPRLCFCKEMQRGSCSVCRDELSTAYAEAKQIASNALKKESIQFKTYFDEDSNELECFLLEVSIEE